MRYNCFLLLKEIALCYNVSVCNIKEKGSNDPLRNRKLLTDKGGCIGHCVNNLMESLLQATFVTWGRLKRF